jgi:hypothetical protein
VPSPTFESQIWREFRRVPFTDVCKCPAFVLRILLSAVKQLGCRVRASFCLHLPNSAAAWTVRAVAFSDILICEPVLSVVVKEVPPRLISETAAYK